MKKTVFGTKFAAVGTHQDRSRSRWTPSWRSSWAPSCLPMHACRGAVGLLDGPNIYIYIYIYSAYIYIYNVFSHIYIYTYIGMADSCMHAEEQLCSYKACPTSGVPIIILTHCHPPPCHTFYVYKIVYISLSNLFRNIYIHVYIYIYIYICICQHTQPRYATLPACMHACFLHRTSTSI